MSDKQMLNKKIKTANKPHPAVMPEPAAQTRNFKNNNEHDDSPANACNCFAVKLAIALLSIIQNNCFEVSSRCGFKEDFYEHCIIQLSGTPFADEKKDTELMLLYCKQMINILRSQKLIRSHNGKAVLSEPLPENSPVLYRWLFDAMWNNTRWEEIFPSSPSAARELQFNKKVLTELLVKSGKKIKLDCIANTFFSRTGFARENDLLQISFLDFYFFSWLKHFGLIKYCGAYQDTPVYIKLTENSGSFLKRYL